MTSSYNQTDDIDNVHSEARPSTQHCPISTSCSGPIVAARGCLQTDRNAVCFPYAIYIAASEIVRPRRPGLFVANGILGMVSIGGSKLQSQLHEFRCQRNLGLGINGEFRSQRKYCLQGSEARMLKDLQAVTAAVDRAWQIWRSDPSSENEAAYDQAYTEWRTFRGERRTGRPASGDTALTSTMRSHATRAHQQEAATRWGRVVLNIQRLRRAFTAGDTAAITRIAARVAHETNVFISHLEIVHRHPNSGCIVLHGFEIDNEVLIFIPIADLEQYFRIGRLSTKQANVVVESNLEILTLIIESKHERGEHRPYPHLESVYLRIDLTLKDIRCCGEPLSTDAVDGLISAGLVIRDEQNHPPTMKTSIYTETEQDARWVITTPPPSRSI